MNTSAHNTFRRLAASPTQRGFSLIELMIAITLSLLIIIALTATFVYNSRARAELERANQQIENGRYANQVLSDDLQLAGFYSQFNVDAALIADTPLAIAAAKPDPCATSLATLRTSMPLHVQGYNNSATLTCISDRKANTDVIVVRRISTCIRGATDCDAVTGAPYFQASTCVPVAGGTELASFDPTEWFKLDSTIANLNRHSKGPGGTCPSTAPMRQYLTHIYFVANNDQAGDGIPTLKRVELGAGGVFSTPIPLADGVENLQFEYGIDNDLDGAPDVFTADPDTYTAPGKDCPTTAADCVTNWRNVMSVKVFLLARNPTPSTDFTDTKTYLVGTGATAGPFNDNFKRHAYQTVVRLTNPAGRRE